MFNRQATLGEFPLYRIILKLYVFGNLKRMGVFLLLQQIAQIKGDEAANKEILLVLCSKRRSKMVGQYSFIKRTVNEEAKWLDSTVSQTEILQEMLAVEC
jgi:hypothetical protein